MEYNPVGGITLRGGIALFTGLVELTSSPGDPC